MYKAIKRGKRHLLNPENETPAKKLVSEGDLFIKQLSEKQLDKNTSLAEQLNTTQTFERSSTYSSLTNFQAGTSSLNNFQNNLEQHKRIDSFKTLGLSEFEIELYDDFLQQGLGYVQTKHKNLREEVIKEHLTRVTMLLEKQQSLEDNNKAPSTSRLEMEFVQSMKPASLETKLLSFALKNRQNKCVLEHPLNELPKLEESLMQNLQSFDPKKVQKKARSLRKKIRDLQEEPLLIEPPAIGNKNTKSLWDSKVARSSGPLKEIVKKYDCKKQQFYTIKDGQIIKLDEAKKIVNKEVVVGDKLTEEQIKLLPKFVNYNKGAPSKVLFVKNLHGVVEEGDLRKYLQEFSDELVSIRVMKGKMKGQAFVEFNCEEVAVKGLEVLNGLCLNGKPMIVQFGRQTT